MIWFGDYCPEDEVTIPIEVSELVVFYTDHPPADAERDTMRRYIDPLRDIVYLYLRDGVWAVVHASVEAEALNAIARGSGPKGETLKWEKA